MNAPSRNCFRQTVTLVHYRYVLDADRARQRDPNNPPTTFANVACAVEPGDPERSEDQERVTMVTSYVITCGADFGLEIEDQVEWDDGARTHLIVVTGVARASGRGPYVVFGEERT